ncbi:ATP-dependent DNA helicase Q4 [Dufourea novaeangliae]|uniref:DNA 3'-5' helicase n=1 Tax=Dufourea novaeangliae TaxID=178035 RepID=A0A154P8N5_DUFNO|nr:ATP-dependent DNA helicase Q4 [Dufourea novaeangliae]
MGILEDPEFQSQYQKYKVRVKLWESRFTEKHGRKPNKNDIKEADIKIKESYKMYWKLKTRALEETLVDITFSDEVQDIISNETLTQTTIEETTVDNKLFREDSQCNTEIIDKEDAQNIDKKNAEDKQNVGNADKKDTENIDPHCNENKLATCDPIEDVAECKNVEGVWGDHLSKSNEQVPKKKQNLIISRSSSFQLSQNKFMSSSFTKRNPRKSLSTSKLKSKSEKQIDTNTNDNKERTTITNANINNALDITEETKPIFGDPVKVTYIEHESATHSIGTVQQLIEGHTITRNLNVGWLGRCAKQNNLEYPALDSQRLSGTSDSGIESLESSTQSLKGNIVAPEPFKSVQVSDEEDFICNSDSEEERKNKRIRNFKKTFSDQDNYPVKRLCTDSNIVNTKADNEDTADTASIKKQPRRRKVIRKIKDDSSDDEDPDYNKNNEIYAKKKESKKTRASTSKKKTTSEKGTNIKIEKKNAPSTRRSSRTKKNVQNDEEDVLEAEGTEDKKSAIYAVETLQAVPRFVIDKNNQGDLIEQCAKSVLSTADNSTIRSVEVKKPKGQLTDKEKLEKKVADGKVNDNFVRINLKKKVFVRGKKNFNFSKYKKNQWKQKKQQLGSSEGSLEVADFVEKRGVMTCFKCGDVGHFSRYCPNRNGDNLIPLEEIDDSSQFPTLEEAEQMASQNAVNAHANRIDRLPQKPSFSSKAEDQSVENETENKSDYDDLWEPIEDEELLCGHKIPEELISKLLPPEIGAVRPLYNTNEDQSCIETPFEVFETLQKFGHETFRPGQEKAVMRILSGQSTLVTLSTGSGKSLCYQLPSYLYSKYSHCITLVISPLVSLMDDQVTGVPEFLAAACLHTAQTPKVRDNVMQLVKQGKVRVLLISPEAVVAGEKSTGFGALLRQLPPIAFACIDEAHCISQWSHNFRPSYLMVSKVLKERLKVRTILALTATATKATAESIVNHLGIHDGMNGVISDIPIPKNLLLSVSRDEVKDQALMKLLSSERFQECDSIIVYCTRREECVRIAGLMRIHLQDVRNPEKPGSQLSSIAEAYHAGLSAYRRRIVQKAFMSGQIRIVVATVAFGMGINKADIRAVIHYNMPGRFEGYVQEEDQDKWELRRHIFSDGVDRHTIRRLLEKVFVPCSCAKLREKHDGYRCPGHEVAIPVDETVTALDIPQEMISTLLCYLELHPKRFITCLSSVYVKARVSSYNGPKGLKLAAQSSPPLAMAIALDLQKGITHDDSSVIEFPVVDVASAIGWDSGVVKSHLKNLEWKTGNGASKRSAISVRYDTLGLRVRAPGDLTEEELDEALDALVSRAKCQETSALQQLETISVTLQKFSMRSVDQCVIINEEITNKSNELKDVIRNYFDGKVVLDVDSNEQAKVENEAEVACDVRNLVISYRDNNFNGRAVARIFHGIQSPNYPAYVWNKCRFWRAHLSRDFNVLCRIATREILALL